MKNVPPWLDHVLARSESLSLDSAEDRAALAAAILKAIPREAIKIAAGAGVSAVLKTRGIRDGAQDIATKAAEIAATNVITVLESA
jgi:hypothetical protein